MNLRQLFILQEALRRISETNCKIKNKTLMKTIKT